MRHFTVLLERAKSASFAALTRQHRRWSTDCQRTLNPGTFVVVDHLRIRGPLRCRLWANGDHVGGQAQAPSRAADSRRRSGAMVFLDGLRLGGLRNPFARMKATV